MGHEAAQSPWLLSDERKFLLWPGAACEPEITLLLRPVHFGIGSWEFLLFVSQSSSRWPAVVQRGRSFISEVGCCTYKRNVVLSALSPRTT
jgi:hypothetical protein